MQLRLEIKEWSDSTDYTVYLFRGESGEGKKTYEVRVMNPDWKAKPVAGKEMPCRVYLDPDSQKVAVIETKTS